MEAILELFPWTNTSVSLHQQRQLTATYSESSNTELGPGSLSEIACSASLATLSSLSTSVTLVVGYIF
jgi:hypothetical protein